MVTADLRPVDPMTVLLSDCPIRIHGVRDAGGQALGEPVEIRLTKAQAKQMIEDLQTAFDAM